MTDRHAVDRSRDNYWFAERDLGRDDYDPRWPWQPTLQGSAWCMSLPTSFATQAECEQFIRDEVADAGLPDDAEALNTTSPRPNLAVGG